MNTKTTIIIVILASITMLTPLVVAAPDEVTYTDEENDVVDEEFEVVDNKPNFDIIQISAIKNENDREVEVKLKLVEEGIIQKTSLLDYFSENSYLYMIKLVTSKDEYDVTYTGIDLSGLTTEQILKALNMNESEIEESELLELTGSLTCLIESSQGIISANSYNVEVNELSIKFYIYDINEKLIALTAQVFGGSESQGFADYYEGTQLYPVTKSTYETKAGTTLTLEATLEEGTGSDYNWLWVFEDSTITFTQQNPSYKFNIPKVYKGTVYVYDDEGSWGSDEFIVNVTGTSTNGGDNDNNEPGFELILVITAAAIALLIFRKKKK